MDMGSSILISVKDFGMSKAGSSACISGSISYVDLLFSFGKLIICESSKGKSVTMIGDGSF
jgi:hypothetical protein